MRVILGFLMFFCAGWPAGARTPAWQVWEGCRWIDNAYNDGDSFHVQHGTRRFVLRLYFVDAPETDLEFPDRVAEQARYFGVDERAVMWLGRRASDYVQRMLGRGAFTVYTRREDAGGRSRGGRYFGMVQTGDRWLCELLAENGMVRIYGMPTDLPDGTSAARHIRRLKERERVARRTRAGGWGLRPQRLRGALPFPGQIQDTDGDLP